MGFLYKVFEIQHKYLMDNIFRKINSFNKTLLEYYLILSFDPKYLARKET